MTAACVGEPVDGPGSEAARTAATGRSLPCVAPDAVVAVDHVIFVTRDLAAASDSFRALGFTIKPGRLHPGGLLNAHVKFRSAQEVELMTVAAPPSDELTRRYARLLEDGEGGAYLALAAPDLDAVAAQAAARGLRPARGSSGPFRFVSFPDDTAAMAVFFGGRSTVFDPDSLLDHPNGARGIREVWLEGGAPLSGLLEDLGARPCGRAAASGREGRRFALANATVVVLEPVPGRRPRMRAARLEVAGQDRWVGSLPAGGGAAAEP